jgi:hypothetical protein
LPLWEPSPENRVTVRPAAAAADADADEALAPTGRCWFAPPAPPWEPKKKLPGDGGTALLCPPVADATECAVEVALPRNDDKDGCC